MKSFKGKVKSLIIKSNGEYQVSFGYTDKIKCGNEECGVAFDTEDKTKLLSLKYDFCFKADKEIFNFISQHTKEVVEIHYKEKNDKRIIKEVKLSYE